MARKKKISKECAEGFWKQSKDEVSELPWPEESSKDFKNKDKFLENLHEKQVFNAQAIHFKGFSICRVCGINNGSIEYVSEYDGVRFKWPEGYAHYIEKHGVYPSKEFYDFIMKP